MEEEEQKEGEEQQTNAFSIFNHETARHWPAI